MATAPRRIARKLSCATVTGMSMKDMQNLCLEDKKRDNPLYSIVGTARGFRTGQTNLGDWVALTGEFEAVNLKTGEVHNGGRYFPPPYVCDLLTPAITSGGENAAVEFALVIGVKWSDNMFGMEYYADTYMDPQEADSIKRLKNLLPNPQELMQLAAPKGEQQTETKSEQKGDTK